MEGTCQNVDSYDEQSNKRVKFNPNTEIHIVSLSGDSARESEDNLSCITPDPYDELFTTAATVISFYFYDSNGRLLEVPKLSSKDTNGQAVDKGSTSIDLKETQTNPDLDNMYRPLFVHQVFENEKIRLPKYFLVNPDVSFKIAIHVRCSDLFQFVSLPSELLDNEYQYITDQLLKSTLSSSSSIIAQDLKVAFPPAEDPTTSSKSLPGTSIHRFVSKNGESYDIRLATAKDFGASELLSRCERLAIWNIETADSVNFNDDRWEAVFLFQLPSTNREKDSQKSLLIGYMTLFTFINPFAGAKMRICQALILPFAQGRGLGKHVMHSIYSLALGREAVVEITVEDPAPGFQNLRDIVDVEHVSRQIQVKLNDDPSRRELFSRESLTVCLEQHSVDSVAMCCKITKGQAQFAISALQYLALPMEDSCVAAESVSVVQGEELKLFRLTVKRQLLNANKDLKRLSKEDMQRQLEDLYQEQLERFQRAQKSFYIMKR